jgi:protein-S-isoprenylcysteine O-methyltransferase Ste14
MNWFITALWVIFIVYWVVSAIGTKKIVRHTGSNWWRIIFIIVVIIGIWFSQEFSSLRTNPVAQTLPVQIISTVLVAAGMAFAVWARVHLGKNWSPTPSVQENHELVTSGPYRFVRHPIYTGIITALLGSALTGGLVWILVFLAFTGMIAWRVGKEEEFMQETFPDQYPAYKKRTKAVIPFIW